MISDTLSDDADMQREIRNLFTRCNILAGRFAKCSLDMKIASFTMYYCICLYDGLWLRYKSRSLSKLTSCYNKCLKLFFAYKRRDSVTQILLNLGLPSFKTVLHNSSTVLHRSLYNSRSEIVMHLNLTLC